MYRFGLCIVTLASLFLGQVAFSEQIYFGVDGQVNQQDGIILGVDYTHYAKSLRLSGKSSSDLNKHTQLMRKHIEKFLGRSSGVLNGFDLVDKITWGNYHIYTAEFNFSNPVVGNMKSTISLPVVCENDQCLIDNYLNGGSKGADLFYGIRNMAIGKWFNGQDRVTTDNFETLSKDRNVFSYYPVRNKKIGRSIIIAYPFERVKMNEVSLLSDTNASETYSRVWAFFREIKKAGAEDRLKIIEARLGANHETLGFIIANTAGRQSLSSYFGAKDFIRKIVGWDKVFPVGIVRGVRHINLVYRANNSTHGALQVVTLRNGQDFNFAELPFESDQASLLLSTGAIDLVEKMKN